MGPSYQTTTLGVSHMTHIVLKVIASGENQEMRNTS